MSILATKTETFGNPHDRLPKAANGRFFSEAKEADTNPVAQVARKARELLLPLVMDRINFCDSLVREVGGVALDTQERNIRRYDAEAAVKKGVGEAITLLQQELPPLPFRMGNNLYFMIQDPYARTGNPNQLILLEDDGSNVSFMEPRGLEGDKDLTPAGYLHFVQVAEDIMLAAEVAET